MADNREVRRALSDSVELGLTIPRKWKDLADNDLHT
jgi:hypothetical protein